MIYAWSALEVISFLLILSLTGVTIGKNQVSRGILNPALLAWVISQGLLMFACLFTLVSLLCWRVIVLMLQTGAQKNLNITPTWRGGWAMVRPSRTSSVTSTSQVKPVQPVSKTHLKDSRLKQETLLPSKTTKSAGGSNQVQNLPATSLWYSIFIIIG